MATFLDLTGLEAFSRVFLLILIIVVAYVFISNSNFTGGSKWIVWIIAFILGIFSIMSDLLANILKSVVPWVGVLLVFTLFIMIAGKTMGATVSDYADFKWALLAITIVIFLVATGVQLREQIDVPGDIDEDGNEIVDDDYISTTHFLLHPKILGVIFVLLVSIFTVALMVGKSA